jgi:hypothetical protein
MTNSRIRRWYDGADFWDADVADSFDGNKNTYAVYKGLVSYFQRSESVSYSTLEYIPNIIYPAKEHPKKKGFGQPRCV